VVSSGVNVFLMETDGSPVTDGTATGSHGNDRLVGVAVGNNSVENVIGTGFDDVVNGDRTRNTLEGRGGNDRLRGDEGDDVILGGDGDDIIEGDGWVDTQTPWGSPISAPTNFSVSGTSYTHLPSGNDNLDGGAGNDTLYASDSQDPFDGDGASPAINALAAPGGDILDGGSGNDQLYGHEGADTLLGDDGFAEAGNDTLFGLLGADFLFGGNDTDILVGGSGVDVINAGTGPMDGSDEIRVEATGPVGGKTLADAVIIMGTPNLDTIRVKGVDSFDIASMNAIEAALRNEIGIVSDYELGQDVLDFVSFFSDFDLTFVP
jgi:Ca2+-binding RTX toxin-like protein